jgi:hypothetical protein
MRKKSIDDFVTPATIKKSINKIKINMSENKTTSEFKPVKKLSPFVSDPFNTRGGKGGKGSSMASFGVKGGGKKINVSTLKKGGSGGDR